MLPRDFRIRLHIHIADSHSLGPGKAELLEAIDRDGSISAAARALGMAYRHAWELVEDLNQCFTPGVVETASGGSRGGGSRLTPFGRELLRRFRAMEAKAASAIAPDLAELARQRARPIRKKARARRR